jgi:hypothetical protein
MHLMDYAWQRLSATEAGAVEHHLSGCPGCRAVLEEELSLGALLHTVPPVAPRRDLWQAVRARQMALDMPSGLAPSARLMEPVLAARALTAHAWQRWTTALAVGAAALALMFLPGRPTSTPGQGAMVIAQTLDTARQVSRQSDDPMAEVSDDTLDVLSAAADAGVGRRS